MNNVEKKHKFKEEFMRFMVNLETDFDKTVEGMSLDTMTDEEVKIYPIIVIGELLTNVTLSYQLLLARIKDEAKDAIHGEHENGRPGTQDSGINPPDASH